MSERSKPPFRADHVGSLIRTQALVDARAKREAGEISDAALKDVLSGAHLAPVVLPIAQVDPTPSDVVRWLRAEGAA